MGEMGTGFARLEIGAGQQTWMPIAGCSKQAPRNAVGTTPNDERTVRSVRVGVAGVLGAHPDARAVCSTAGGGGRQQVTELLNSRQLWSSWMATSRAARALPQLPAVPAQHLKARQRTQQLLGHGGRLAAADGVAQEPAAAHVQLCGQEPALAQLGK